MALNIPYPTMQEPESDAPTIQSVRQTMLQQPGASAQTLTQAAAADNAQRKQQEVATAIKEDTIAKDVATKDFAAQKQLEVQKQDRVLMERISSREAQMQKLDAALYTSLTKDRDKLIVDKEGMKYMNEQQLMEHKIRTVKSQAEWDSYQQKETQLTNAKLEMMDIVHKKMLQQIELESASEKSKLNQEHMKTMYDIEQSWQKNIVDEKKKAAKRSGIGQLVTSVGSGLLSVGMSTGNPYLMGAGGAILATETLAGNEQGGGISQSLV